MTMTNPLIWLHLQRARARAIVNRAGWLSVLLTIGLAPALAQTATECPPTATPMQPAEAQSALRDARDRGFLWRLERNGRTSYLYGTLHIARRDWLMPGPKVREALHASDVIALELDLIDPATMRALQQHLAAAPAIKLPDALGARLAQHATAQCLPAALLAAMRPEMQVATLTLMSGRRDGFDPSYGVDMMLSGFGRGAGKKVVSLETPAAQVDALLMHETDKVPAMVARALDDLDSGHARQQLHRLTNVWGESRLDELEDYPRWCECLDTPEARAQMARLLEGRNPGLADRIEAQHAGGARVFAAVGALHMVGDTALQRLLAQRGFRVERVAFR